jgi:hypothetical protein
MKKNNDKTEYIQNHVITIESRLATIKENIKWLSEDIKVIKKLSKSKNSA